MNKFTKRLLIIAGTFTVLLLLQVFAFAEVRNLINLKAELEKVKQERINKFEAKLVNVQLLSSEERIHKIAADSLHLVKANRPYTVIELSKYEVEQIKKIVESKYE